MSLEGWTGSVFYSKRAGSNSGDEVDEEEGPCCSSFLPFPFQRTAKRRLNSLTLTNQRTKRSITMKIVLDWASKVLWGVRPGSWNKKGVFRFASSSSCCRNHR